jgi:hypothetical protein
MALRIGLGFKAGLLSGTAAVAVLGPYVASATLGEPESSVASEPQQAHASIKATDLGTYRVHESELPSGTTVREYTSSDGKVFAVTWRGPFVPNLRELLGRYFDEYVTAAKAPRGDHHHLEVHGSDLIVQAAGHMRAVQGRAYLPQALPSGVSVGDLQ